MTEESFPEGSYCNECQRLLDEPSDLPADQRKPCSPASQSRVYSWYTLRGSVTTTGFLAGKAKSPAGRSAGLDEPLFLRRGHLDQPAILRIVRNAAARAGLEVKVSSYWLRHSHATHELERRAPVHLVAATLGHTSMGTNGRYCTRGRPTAAHGTWPFDHRDF